jgi:hypothetical protein
MFLIFYTVFIGMKRKVEKKYPFLDRNKLGCVENIKKDESSRERKMGNIYL